MTTSNSTYCERCGKEAKTSVYMRKISGKMEKYDLCRDCAKELKQNGKTIYKVPDETNSSDNGNDTFNDLELAEEAVRAGAESEEYAEYVRAEQNARHSGELSTGLQVIGWAIIAIGVICAFYFASLLESAIVFFGYTIGAVVLAMIFFAWAALLDKMDELIKKLDSKNADSSDSMKNI